MSHCHIESVVKYTSSRQDSQDMRRFDVDTWEGMQLLGSKVSMLMPRCDICRVWCGRCGNSQPLIDSLHMPWSPYRGFPSSQGFLALVSNSWTSLGHPSAQGQLLTHRPVADHLLGSLVTVMTVFGCPK